MKKSILFLVLVLKFNASAAIPTHEIPVDATPACRQFIQSLTADYDYGFLQVPEDWDEPTESPQLHVFYYLKKATAGSTRTPISFYNGGPGFDNHAGVAMLKDQLSVLKDVPFVFIDQRGNGCSSQYPVPQTWEEISRFQYYGTKGIVRDSEAIRQALYGSRKWKLFGQSFGSFTIHRYVTMFPESIDSAFAHGDAITRSPLGSYYYRVLGQKRIMDAYLASNSEVRGTLAKIRALIKPTDCFFKNKFGVCGEGALDGILVTIFGSNTQSFLPKILEKLMPKGEHLDKAFFEALVEKFIFSLYAHDGGPASVSPSLLKTGISPASVTSAQAYIGAMEMEGDVVPEDPGNCKRIGKILADQGISGPTLPLSECRFVLSMQFAGQQVKGVSRHSLSSLPMPTVPGEPWQLIDKLTLDGFENVMKTHTRFDFHLYSGALDTFVPTEMFKEESSEMGPRLFYTDFPNSAHTGFFTEAQIWMDLLTRP